MIGAFLDVLQKLADSSALLDIFFDVSEDADIGNINYQLLKLILPFYDTVRMMSRALLYSTYSCKMLRIE